MFTAPSRPNTAREVGDSLINAKRLDPFSPSRLRSLSEAEEEPDPGGYETAEGHESLSSYASSTKSRRRKKRRRLGPQTEAFLACPVYRRTKHVGRRMKKIRSRDVFLKIYDITEGRAAQWLKPLLGSQIDGIWHTGLVCFKREHFYCDGIQSMASDVVEVKFTMSLRDILYLGRTKVSRKEFKRYLATHREAFSPEKYDLITWNCNHFTENAVAFLFPFPQVTWADSRKGASYPRLPDYVVDQPQEFMSTVRGRLLVWMTKNVLERVDNFLNRHFAQGLDDIIDRWFKRR